MAVSGGRLHIGGTFKTVNAVARTALGAVAPVTGAASPACSLERPLYYRWFTPRVAPSAPTPSSPAAPPTAATGRRQRHDHGLRPPHLRHHPRHPVHRRLPAGLPTGPTPVVSGPRRRRPLLAVPGPVRPQPGLTGFRYPAPHHAPVAQGTEQLSPKQQAAGSSPARGTNDPLSQVSWARKPSSESRHGRPRRSTALDNPNNSAIDPLGQRTDVLEHHRGPPHHLKPNLPPASVVARAKRGAKRSVCRSRCPCLPLDGVSLP
jgi:hypothetical protein